LNLLKLHTVEISDGVCAVSLKGSLDASNVESFEAAARGALEKGARNLLIDLVGAEYVSSTGFSSFLKIGDEAAARGGRIIFVGTPSPIRGIFKVLGLERALAFAADTAAAMAFLSTISGEERPASGPV
jgi:anti-anti-sigma factor